MFLFGVQKGSKVEQRWIYSDPKAEPSVFTFIFKLGLILSNRSLFPVFSREIPRSRCALGIVRVQTISSARLSIVGSKLQGNFELTRALESDDGRIRKLLSLVRGGFKLTWVWSYADSSQLQSDHNQVWANLRLIITNFVHTWVWS